jgi:hypothetical protein
VPGVFIVRGIENEARIVTEFKEEEISFRDLGLGARCDKL